MYTTYMLYMSRLLRVVCRRIVGSRRRLSACYVYCVYFIFYIIDIIMRGMWRCA